MLTAAANNTVSDYNKSGANVNSNGGLYDSFDQSSSIRTFSGGVNANDNIDDGADDDAFDDDFANDDNSFGDENNNTDYDGA